MRLPLSVVFALLLAAPAAAQPAKPLPGPAPANWRFEPWGRWGLATAASEDGVGQLRLICDPEAPIAEVPPTLGLESLAGWTEGAELVLTIDGRAWPVAIGRSGPDYAAIDHRPDRPGYGGIDRSLLDALRGGRVMELGGPAAAGMHPGARRFPLAGAAEALGALIAHCRY